VKIPLPDLMRKLARSSSTALRPWGERAGMRAVELRRAQAELYASLTKARARRRVDGRARQADPSLPGLDGWTRARHAGAAGKTFREL
jgi:L-lactate utilization protein LutB